MTTVDNLTLETSIQYAKNLEQFDAKIIQEASIASKVHTAVIDPTYVSHLSILTSILAGYSPISIFEPPPGYSIQDFSSLALFTREEFNERIQTQVDLDSNRPRISDENKTRESYEATTLKQCIQKLTTLSRCLIEVENNRISFQKG